MSWKASGYVKELRDGLSIADKLVLLVLADYHRTDEKSSWPSMATLAVDCLMTERGIQQVLSRLQDNGFLVKKSGCGRGNITGYQIVGFDVKDELQTSNSSSSFNTERTHSRAEKDAQPCIAIRKEPIKEPIRQTLSVLLEPTSDFSLNSDSTPPKNGKRPKADPRHKVFMEQIQKAHEHFVRDAKGNPITPLLGPSAGNNLKRLLTSQKDLDVDQFRRWLTAYHQSANHNPYDSPAQYILKLPNYEGGTVNEFGRLDG